MSHQKNTELKKIQNKYKREVTFTKRKRGLLKKAMELSVMCSKQVVLLAYDQKSNYLV